MKTRRAIIEAYGGPEVIGWIDEDVGSPGPGEIVVAHEAIGLNFIDTYHRRGIYPVALPSGLGIEAAGRIVAVGPEVAGLAEGDRVAVIGPALGAYATLRRIRASDAFPLPAGIDSETAAASIVKLFTAECLIERCARVRPGMDVLVHAAAGGVGLFLVQWLKAIGARVIGTVGSAEKAELARAAGADDIILYTSEPVAPRVRALTGGAGVRVVFDGVGQDTWEASLDSCGKRGLIVSYGNASAPVTGVGLGILAGKGSLFVTRPLLFDYYADTAERAAGAARSWALLESGAVRVTVGQRFPLAEAARAHRALEARETMGSTLLIP